MSAEEAIRLLKYQYLQLVDPKALQLPPSGVLKRPEVQEAIYATIFCCPTAAEHPPPARYTVRVLKRLMTLIEVRE